MIRKLVISNGRSERELLLVGNIVIGRDPACHVSEADPLLSRRHAEILANVHGVSVRDLNSRNGILVNGEKTREQVLLPGDVVQLGHLQLRYVEENVRAADGLVSRGFERRPQAPPQSSAPAFDRFRPEPTPQPGRWKPEPTPLPGRRTSAPPPPTTQPSHSAVPRGRAAFEQEGGTPGRGQDRFDETMLARPGLHDTTLGPGPVDLDATMFAPIQPSRDQSGNRWPDPDPRMPAPAPVENTMVPGDATFAAAISHLAGLGQPEHEQVRPGPGARLVANSELTITDCTPGCAELLGIPGEELIGDSLTDVFLRGVRRAYSDTGTVVTLSIARGSRGSITVTFTLEKNGGTER